MMKMKNPLAGSKRLALDQKGLKVQLKNERKLRKN